MPKTEVKVNQKLLSAAIAKAEESGPKKNRNELYQAVANIYNQMGGVPRQITPAIVGLRIKSWKINVTTPVGKRGRQAGTVLSAEHRQALADGRKNRHNRGERFTSPEALKILDELESVVPERFRPLVDRVRKGSRAAADKLKCLDCSCYQTQEIKHCTVRRCPMYLFRPYQGSAEEADDTVEDQGAEITTTGTEPDEAA